MSRLLEGPMKPWIGEAAEEVRSLDEPDLKGFEILQDSRILDLRSWNPDRVREERLRFPGLWLSAVEGLQTARERREQPLPHATCSPTSPLAQVRFPPQQLQPKLSMSRVEGDVPGEKKCLWEASCDFRAVPAGDFVDLIYEHLSPGRIPATRGEGSASLAVPIRAETAELTRWILLPEGKEYRSFRMIRYETGKPEKAEAVKIVTEYLAEDKLDPRLQIAVAEARLHLRGHLVLRVGTRVAQPRGR